MRILTYPVRLVPDTPFCNTSCLAAAGFRLGYKRVFATYTDVGIANPFSAALRDEQASLENSELL